MDAELKEKVEALYSDMGTSVAEYVRIFAKQNIRENGIKLGEPGFDKKLNKMLQQKCALYDIYRALFCAQRCSILGMRCFNMINMIK